MTVINPVRSRMVAIGAVYAAHARQFAYSETATRAEIFNLTYPELLARLAAGETITGDCSSTYEATRKFAGCEHLPPLGYTGTELETMPHITLKTAMVGDAIVIGEYPGKHVVWIAEPDPVNPLTYGHGEPGFTEIRLLTMMRDAFPGQPITVLSLAPYLPEIPVTKPSGIVHFSGTLNLETGKGTIKGEPGDKVVFGTDDSERSLTITVKAGGKDAGTWTAKP